MKKQLLLAFFCTLFVTSLFANKPNSEDFPKAGLTSMTDEAPFWQYLTHEELMTLSPKKIKDKTGQKVSFKDKMLLKIARKASKKATKKQNRGDLPFDKTSVASFVLSGLGLLAFVVPFVFGLFAIAGLVLGIIALTRKGNYDSKRGRGFAIAGVILGGLYLILTVLVISSM